MKSGLTLSTVDGGESVARYQIGSWPKELGQDDSTSFFLNRSLAYTERELYSVQAKGKHVLPAMLNTELEWSVSTASTRQDEPDTRFFASTDRTIGVNRVQSATSSGFSDPARYFRELQEDSDGYQLDITIPFRQWSGSASKVKVGALYQITDRVFSERIFTYDPNLPFDGDESSYFSNNNLGIVALDTGPAKIHLWQCHSRFLKRAQ